MTRRVGRQASRQTRGGLRLKRSLGQHFLKDDNVARKIAGAIDPQPGEVMVEIGPGEGALTRYLVRKGCRLVAVELDDRVIEGLRLQFGGEGFELIHADILETDLSVLAARYGERLRIAGNIPYNITSPILFHVLEHRAAVRDLTIMMQREVAVRLASGPGGREYGIPAVLFGLFADITPLFDVAPGSFVPPPAVVSSVLSMRMLPQPRYAVEDEAYFRALVRSVFGHRRKTLRNTLKAFLGTAELPAGLPVDTGRRPEELSIEEFVNLSNVLSATTHGVRHFPV
jgi:16S rRNA (adenine1518-N6/adenine1519-N6)-dimethyltransferase